MSPVAVRVPDLAFGERTQQPPHWDFLVAACVRLEEVGEIVARREIL